MAKKTSGAMGTARLSEWRQFIRRPGTNINQRAKEYLAFISQAKRNPLTDAYKYFSLNPKSPSHRAFLLLILADVSFVRPFTQRGRPTMTGAWDWKAFALLNERFEALSPQERRKIGGKNGAAEIIYARFPKNYSSAETVRQRLTQARKMFRPNARLRSEWTSLSDIGRL